MDKIYLAKALLSQGKTVAEVSQHVKLAVSVVRYWQSRQPYAVRGKTADLGPKNAANGKRARRATNPAIRRRRATILNWVWAVVEQGGKARPAPVSTRAIASSLKNRRGCDVSHATVARDLKALGLTAYLRQRDPTVYEGDCERRLVFLHAWGRLPTRLGRSPSTKIIFSDEKIFTVNDDSLEAPVRRQPRPSTVA